jgi:hypothetical protein
MDIRKINTSNDRNNNKDDDHDNVIARYVNNSCTYQHLNFHIDRSGKWLLTGDGKQHGTVHVYNLHSPLTLTGDDNVNQDDTNRNKDKDNDNDSDEKTVKPYLTVTDPSNDIINTVAVHPWFSSTYPFLVTSSGTRRRMVDLEEESDADSDSVTDSESHPSSNDSDSNEGDSDSNPGSESARNGDSIAANHTDSVALGCDVILWKADMMCSDTYDTRVHSIDEESSSMQDSATAHTESSVDEFGRSIINDSSVDLESNATQRSKTANNNAATPIGETCC